MTHYKSNLRDLEFNLFEVFGADRTFGQAPYADLDVDTARSILSEVDRLAREELAPSFVPGAPGRSRSRTARSTSRV